ncbi:pyridoxamine 5'-phosphate oxidase family protein [Sporichthya polymorpha]|uniref:pyridoxamine 5'-phosphate oxidase family protein n=1 Tax=Sporichthya polymorpha TaxID=35751 RepID=UPI0003647D03|nr:pyridoxamine 5'-phosphate oxidase family protein [Sporichthya polymorpha]
MYETPEDLAALQELLDRSRAGAGGHLADIFTADRWLDAKALTERLQSMCLLSLATVTADNRPLVGAVDAFFIRGSFCFGSSPTSVRARHIAARPQVSAVHLPGEHLSVTVHGQAHLIGWGTEDPYAAPLLDALRDKYGADNFGEQGAPYWRIEAAKMFVFHMDPEP